MIEIENVAKVFNRGTVNEVVELRNITLRLGEGEFVTVVGSNGAGKTTLLNTVAGVLPCDQGRIRIAGKDVTNQEEHKRAALIGRVFQNPMDGTAGTLTVEENLAMALLRGRARGLRAGVNADRRRFFKQHLEALELGLEERPSTTVALLSGGQRQALAVLMATIQRPPILLLDEHTANLDPAAADLVMRLTERLIREHGLTALMVTHNMQQAISHGDRTLMMHEGEIALDIAGPEREGLTVQDMVDRFMRVRRQALVDDEMLLVGGPTPPTREQGRRN